MKLITTFSKKEKNIAVLSHSLNEAITKCIINNRANFTENITIVSLQELLFDYKIFDKICDTGTHIKWIKNSNLITNNTYSVLNRVLYVPDALFSSFKKIDRIYAKREFEAYIGFSLNAFKGIGNQTANGSCAESLSLPQQWRKIEQKFKINVPNYYWGLRDFNHLNCNNLIYSHIYNFFNWSTNTNSIEANHIFCFEKPKGKPVFILSIGDEQLVTADSIISDQLELQLKILGKKINKFFNHFISEILIFVEDKNIYFGCINPEIKRSCKNTNFDTFVCSNLISEFYKWMN